jgi:drug efflux transport system ATP-binding protein
MEAETVVETTNLTKNFADVAAVKGINLNVRRGEIYGLVGADGAGKTTTLRMLGTLSLPSSGKALIFGRDIVKEADGVKQVIGYMSESFNLYGSLTVRENLDFFARLRGVPPVVAKTRQDELLEFCRLQPFTERLAEHLSGGMQKKLALAVALQHEPELLFLDEPTTGVDPVSRRDFWRIISGFVARGVTVLCATPYMDEAERFNRVALMHQGEIIADDTPQNLKMAEPGELLEIRAEPTGRALSLLKRASAASHPQIFGDTIHLPVDNAANGLADITRLFAENQVRLHDARPIPPSLEDVFVARLSAQLEPAAATAPATVSPIPASRHIERAEAAITVSALTRKFGDFTAVDNVSFEVATGKIFGLLGPNGSGKTTTIRMITGLLEPTSGQATVAGENMAGGAPAAKRRMGYMSQKFSLFGDLTVAENITFYGGLYGLSATELKDGRDWVLGMAGLNGKETALTRDLAGGWKQRLALGCSIIHRPEVIFLDEPTAGVDPQSRRFFWELIQELADGGTTVFITTHYMDEAERCHRLGLMYNARLIALGSTATLKTEYARGELLEITCSDFDKALELLTTRPEYRRVSFFGSIIHLIVSDAATAEVEIKNILADGGLKVHAINRIPFTMEDIFISLVEEQERAMTPQITGKGA